MTPSSLIQLLRFWVPRTDLLDKALVGSIREPLLFLDFDRSAEAVTLRILRELSRFAAVDEVSPSLLRRVILNRGLRAQLSRADDLSIADAGSLIESAVIEEAQELEDALAARRRERGVATEQQVAQLELSTSELSEAQEAIQRLDGELTRTRVEGDATAAQLRDARAQLEDHVRSVDAQAARARSIRRAVAVSTLLGGVVAGLCLLGGIWLRPTFTNGWVPWLGIAAVGTLIWILGTELICQRDPALHGAAVVERISKLRGWLVTGIAAIAAGLAATAIWVSRK